MKTSPPLLHSPKYPPHTPICAMNVYLCSGQKVRNCPLWCQVTTQHCILRPLQQIEPRAFGCFAECLSFLGWVLSSQAQGCSKCLLYHAKRFSSLPRSSTFASRAGPPGSFSKFEVLGIRRPVVYCSGKWHSRPCPYLAVLLSTFYMR